MQVRVGEGQWADVTLAPNEVVVVLGHSLQVGSFL